MKTLFLVVAFAAIASLTFAQDTLYLNSRNEEVKKRKQAETFKVVTKTDTGYVMEILGKTLDLRSRTVYRDSELKTLEGYYVDYAGNSVFTEGRYLNGKKDGPWNYYYNGRRTAAVVYGDDRIVKADYYKANGEPETDKSKIEQLPSFNGGQQALGAYLTRTLKYPKVAFEKKVSGTVQVEFTVLADGQVTDVDVIRSVSAALDMEAARVVRQMPRWNPGVQFGRPVKVRYKMPIAFRLM